MEGLAKLIPCDGKGKAIAEVYVNFNEDDIERIISEGVSDKNQCMSMEIDDASEIEEGKKYNISLESASAKNNYDPIAFDMKQVLVERITGANVRVIVTGSAEKR